MPRMPKRRDAVATQKPVVYFIQAESGGPIKIGKTTKSIRKRLGSLQTGNVSKLIVLATTGKHTEEYLHERFKAWRISGEWFRPVVTLLQWIQLNAVVTTDGHRHLAKVSVWNEANHE